MNFISDFWQLYHCADNSSTKIDNSFTISFVKPMTRLHLSHQTDKSKTHIMRKSITIIVLFVTAMLSAQGKFEEGMGKAFQLWKDGKADEASAMFERIASAEKNSWLPNYYVA